jgi:hypothetical protein
MPRPAPNGRAARARRRKAERRTRRFAGLAALTIVVSLTLLLTAFGSESRRPLQAVPASAALLSNEPPSPQVVATRGRLRLQLPVAQSRVTAIGYHAAGGALALQPLGRQGNQGLLGRLADRILGTEHGRLVYYLLGGGDGPATAVLDVGAPAGSDVYSPVDGTIVGITDYVLDGRRRGVRIDLQPTSSPSLVVSITRLRPDPSLTVGSPVAAAASKLGSVLDLSRIERQSLARFTQDAGNHVSLEVRHAPTLGLN